MSLCINPVCPQPNHPDNDRNYFCQSCGSPLELLGTYRVVRLLSDHTGFSKVYEVYQQDILKILKVLKQQVSNDDEAKKVFEQEMSDLGQLEQNDMAPEYFTHQTSTGMTLHCMVVEKNVMGGLNTQIVTETNTEQNLGQNSEKPLAKLPLVALLWALLCSLFLLWLVAFTNRDNRFVVFPSDYGQLPIKKGEVDYFAYEEGQDSQGRVAEFNIAVLSVEYKWQLGSTYQIKYNNEIINLESLKSRLQEEGIQTIMEDPSEIISVGTASCEGDIKSEQSRALERSKQIQLLVKKLFSDSLSVKAYRLLNLGQFQRKDCQSDQDLTAYQRSIIIIGVKKQDEGVILDEALRDRLEKKPFADFKLEDYSLGGVDIFKTISSNL